MHRNETRKKKLTDHHDNKAGWPRVSVEDVREAMGALMGDPYIASVCGPDFPDLFARNSANYKYLPEAARERIAAEYLEMAAEKSYRSSVLQKYSEEKSIMLARWLLGVNLLLAMTKPEHRLREAKAEHAAA